LGIKPLYYGYSSTNDLLFGSEIKCFSQISSCSTISYLRPGHIYQASPSSTTCYPYYSLPPFSLSTEPPYDFGEIIRKNFLETVASHLPPNCKLQRFDPRFEHDSNQQQGCEEPKRVAVLLSGGVDSSSVLAALTILCESNYVEAFTFSTDPSSPSSDLISAQLVCAHLGVTHHTIVSPTEAELGRIYLEEGVKMVESYEPVLVRNAVSYNVVCRAVRAAGYKVCFTGEGADEIFGGYDYYKQIQQEEQREAAIYQSLSELYLSYLHMADRASMQTMLEIRVPFVDSRFVDFCCSLPTTCRIGEGSPPNSIQEGSEELKDKIGLRLAFSDILPKSITERKKVGMTEGAGFGQNRPTIGVYAKAVQSYYEEHPAALLEDKQVCLQHAEQCKLNLEDLEEVYNFSIYKKLGYCKLDCYSSRLQLNTPLISTRN